MIHVKKFIFSTLLFWAVLFPINSISETCSDLTKDHFVSDTASFKSTDESNSVNDEKPMTSHSNSNEAHCIRHCHGSHVLKIGISSEIQTDARIVTFFEFVWLPAPSSFVDLPIKPPIS